MSIFKFRLQKVLDFRALTELESAGRVAEAQRDANRAQQSRNLLEGVRNASLQQLAAAHGAGGTIGQFQNLGYIIDRLNDQLSAADADCRTAEERLRSSISDYTIAMRGRRVLDHLRERKLGTWRAEEARHEQKTMDEVAVANHQNVAGGAGLRNGTRG